MVWFLKLLPCKNTYKFEKNNKNLYFCIMNNFRFLIFIFITVFCGTIKAQNPTFRDSIPSYFVSDGDTMKVFVLGDIYVYPPHTFANRGEEERYYKLIRDIKRTLPYAKLIYRTLIETYEYMMTLPDDKAREEHIKRMEKDLFAEYKPILRRMSLAQGRMLIKLIDRECNQTSYNIVRAFLGPFRAGFWNLFAGMFGASLKTEWDPEGKDAAAERIVQMIEMGIL